MQSTTRYCIILALGHARRGVLLFYIERPTIIMAMARVRDTIGVLNGLRQVAVAYSAVVTREMEEIVSNVSIFLKNRSGMDEGSGIGGRGLSDDFPGWENFTAGEFGLGAEYDSPTATPPNAHHPRATHDATDSQTHERNDIRHNYTPPSDVLNHINGGQRSYHSIACRGLLLGRTKAFHQLKATRRSGRLDLGKSVRHYTTSGDTVVGSSATDDDKTQGSQSSHVEQQKKVEPCITDECLITTMFPPSLSI